MFRKSLRRASGIFPVNCGCKYCRSFLCPPFLQQFFLTSIKFIPKISDLGSMWTKSHIGQRTSRMNWPFLSGQEMEQSSLVGLSLLFSLWSQRGVACPRGLRFFSPASAAGHHCQHFLECCDVDLKGRGPAQQTPLSLKGRGKGSRASPRSCTPSVERNWEPAAAGTPLLPAQPPPHLWWGLQPKGQEFYSLKGFKFLQPPNCSATASTQYLELQKGLALQRDSLPASW